MSKSPASGEACDDTVEHTAPPGSAPKVPYHGSRSAPHSAIGSQGCRCRSKPRAKCTEARRAELPGPRDANLSWSFRDAGRSNISRGVVKWLQHGIRPPIPHRTQLHHRISSDTLKNRHAPWSRAPVTPPTTTIRAGISALPYRAASCNHGCALAAEEARQEEEGRQGPRVHPAHPARPCKGRRRGRVRGPLPESVPPPGYAWVPPRRPCSLFPSSSHSTLSGLG